MEGHYCGFVLTSGNQFSICTLNCLWTLHIQYSSCSSHRCSYIILSLNALPYHYIYHFPSASGGHIEINTVLKASSVWDLYQGANCHVGIKGFVWKTNEFGVSRSSTILPTYERSWVILLKRNPFSELMPTESVYKVQQVYQIKCWTFSKCFSMMAGPSIFFQAI